MSTRADRYTQLQKIPDSFSDFLTDLTPHPITKDLTRARNEQSIKQSIRNLVLTNYGERPFQPGLGSTVYRSLFEPNDSFLQEDIKDSIRRTVESNEPRAIIDDVNIITSLDRNIITVNILFFIINNSEQQSLDIVLRRVR